MQALQTGHISGVNMARIVGAIGIVVFHYGCHNSYLMPFLCSSANANWGCSWVALFLAISGACLARTYAANFDLKQYFRRRWIAVFPLFYLIYLFFALQQTVSVGAWWSGIPFYRFIYTLLGVDGYLYFYQPNFYIVGEWFLGAIIACYVLFPVLRWLLMRIPYTTTALLLIGTYFIPYLPFFMRNPFQNLWTCVTIFYLGMFLAQFPSLLNSKTALWISTLLTIILLCVHIPFYSYLRIVGELLTGIVLWVSLTNLGRICEQNETCASVLAWLGKMSFPIFLVQHQVILSVLKHWGGSSLATAIGGLFMSIVLSSLLAWLLSLAHERIMHYFKW